MKEFWLRKPTHERINMDIYITIYRYIQQNNLLSKDIRPVGWKFIRTFLPIKFIIPLYSKCNCSRMFMVLLKIFD